MRCSFRSTSTAEQSVQRPAFRAADLSDFTPLSCGWRSARFSPGERVTVWAPNLPEWVLLEFGAARAGVVLVTVNPPTSVTSWRTCSISRERPASCW